MTNEAYHIIAARNAGGIADFIQPSLVQLQPNLEDFMDTLEPLQGKDAHCIWGCQDTDYKEYGFLGCNSV